MSFHGGLAGVMIAMWLYGASWALRCGDDRLCRAHRATGPGFRPHRQFHQRRTLGQADRRAVGVQRQRPVAASVDAVRGASRRARSVCDLWWYSAKPRPYMAVSGLFLLLYGLFRFAVEFVACRIAPWLPRAGLAHDGPDTDAADDRRGAIMLSWPTVGREARPACSNTST